VNFGCFSKVQRAVSFPEFPKVKMMQTTACAVRAALLNNFKVG